MAGEDIQGSSQVDEPEPIPSTQPSGGRPPKPGQNEKDAPSAVPKNDEPPASAQRPPADP
jgi:hypothetical protein